MSCPYLAKATDPSAREDRPDMGNVCYGHGAVNPYWGYQPVGLDLQDDLCLKSKAYLKCPVYLKAQQKGHAAPIPAAEVSGSGGRRWWPF